MGDQICLWHGVCFLNSLHKLCNGHDHAHLQLMQYLHYRQTAMLSQAIRLCCMICQGAAACAFV